MKVKILRLGTNGEGVFEINEGDDKGKIAFVDFALPDEIADVEIVNNKSKFAIAKLNSIDAVSKFRVVPKCKYFGTCGGCDLQHMDESYQDNFKINKVKFALKKYVTNFDIQLVTTNKCNYRNKMVFPFAMCDGQVVLGMYQRNTHNVVDIDYCMLSRDAINKVLSVAKEFFKNSKYKAYDEKSKTGCLKYLVVRELNNEILVSVVCKSKCDMLDFYGVLSKNFEKVGLNIVISNSDKDIMSGTIYKSYGLTAIQLEEYGIKYEINNFSFLQVNQDIKHMLYDEVFSHVNSEIVIDAYSGAGLLSAIISKNARHVIGIEINKDAAISANKLKLANNIKNIEYINGDTKVVLPSILEKYANSNLVLDPARSGCDKQVLLDIINSKNKPSKIIYISCNLATLKRDLDILTEKYAVTSIKCFDMFPYTKHIETLVCLQGQA